MLLPSDVARLVLGYLQEEGLSATSQAFIHESPNLKEYADHTIGDGTIPACVFSVFGKGLTTILNEYVATKTKESRHEVPAMMTSLWKKLDFTLNQIKSLQNSPSIAACQRTRSRIGVANLARQRVLTVSSPDAVVCSSISETSSIISSADTSHSMLGHSTPVSYSAAHTRPAIGNGTHQQIQEVRLNTPRDSPIQMLVSEHRMNTGPMSPGRRKWDTPRKRGGAVNVPSGPSRCATATSNPSNPSAEPQAEEAVDENFPQLVIQNARDKILGDRSLQEKLAENINKILASDPVPQTSKAPSSMVEADQSIDEILGLQGEIHMSDDAIQDILEQTENDPAFQALYDLFDCNKTKCTDGENGENSSIPEDSATAGPSSAVRSLQSDDPDTALTHATIAETITTTATTVKRTGQDRKTRKSTASTLLKKTILGPGGRTSRIENSSARLIVSQGECQSASSAAVVSNKKKKASNLNNNVFVTPMDVDEPLNTPPPPPSDALDSTSSQSSTVSTCRASAAFSLLETAPAFNVDKKQELKEAAAASLAQNNEPAFLSPVSAELNNAPALTSDLPHIPISSSGGAPQPLFAPSVTPETSSSLSVSVAAPFTASPGSAVSASTSATLMTTPASSATTSPALSTSCATVNAVPEPPTSGPTTPSRSAADSNVVSLKIIISDNQEESSSSDPALTQAVSSISGDKIPTIYLSSPAKSSGGGCTPSLDEAAQAVNGLQSSEIHASPLRSKVGALVASPLTSQLQQNYIIQLDTTSPAIQGAAASYFLVTEPPSTDAQSRQVLLPAGVSKGQTLPINQFGMSTTASSPSFSSGSTLILPSPVKPIVLPVSAVGPNPLGKVQVLPNQVVAVPNAVAVPQAETPQTPAVAIKWSTTAGTDQHLIGQLVQPENTGQQETAKGSTHRRILCFESSADVQPKAAKIPIPPATSASTSRSVQHSEKDDTQTRTKPAILGGNKPKRRVQTILCSENPQTDRRFVKDAEKSTLSQQHHKDPVKKNPRKQDHSIQNQVSQSENASQPETSKKTDSERRPRSTNKKQIHEKDGDEAKTKDSHSSQSSVCDSAPKSGNGKEKEESTRKEPSEKAPTKSREGRTEKRTLPQEMPNVTANKENEIKGSIKEQQQSVPSSSASFSPSAATQPTPTPQSKASKTPSKTSSLAKQAAEMLNDIQGLKSPSTSKRPAASSSELPRTPGVACNQEQSTDCPRTPSRQKKGKDGEGTPKHLMPPNTPDVPTCSPASEAGSESSINMAAHTLMILSRAAIARTGTPLKDSLRQDGAGKKSPTSSKNSKKRKLSSPTVSSPAKKDRERKKLVDCFPHDLDVDKFLSSLHYDE
ncbi:uncharacterized protein V6R79_016047 [Siganus canaliculatus]